MKYKSPLIARSWFHVSQSLMLSKPIIRNTEWAMKKQPGSVA